jgi:ferredoxin
MKVTRNIIQIDDELCDGCGNCVPSCAEGAIEIIDGKAKVIADKYCDGLGACLGDCPQGALKVIERKADEFDEEAVEELLKEQAADKKAPVSGGCPSAALKTFPMAHDDGQACNCSGNAAAQPKGGASALGHWPVKIRLVPAAAPFLKGADLLIAADCASVAYPSFHKDFLEGKAVMAGCPKFDDAAGYVEKLAQVFSESGIKSITSVVMEVPCCSGMSIIIKKALEKSGANIPFTEVVISAQGKIIS